MEKNKKTYRNRRDILRGLVALSAVTIFPALSNTMNHTYDDTFVRNNNKTDEPKNNNIRQHRIAIIIYPDMTPLDMIGPQTVFMEAGCQVDLLWKNYQPIVTDLGIPLTATTTFDEYSIIPDVLLIPGGIGSIDYMNDLNLLEFIQKISKKTPWITSVCTGSLILAGAGLLRGYKATSHWATKNLLGLMGAIPTEGRVVTDRNRITGGGVTAGIDFGLVLLEKLQGREIAEQIALSIEYAPEPPFNVGTPDLAGPDRMKIAMKENEDFNKIALKAAKIARKRLNLS